MRLQNKTFYKIMKGFSYDLEQLILDNNKINDLDLEQFAT